MPEIQSLAAAELLRLYRPRGLSAVEMTRAQLDRIEKCEPAINAFIIIDREGALAAAKASETRWQKGEPVGLLDGLGATVKDNVWLKGFPSRRGSVTSDPAPVKADPPAVARLREHGAVILGKTTLPEFGRGGAGSIPIPSAFPGVFGIKPSFGRVAAYPASPFSILAHVGPLTRTVGDAALMLSVISGPDERDMTAWNTPAPDFRVGLQDGVRGLRVARSPRLGYVAKPDPPGRAG